MRQSPGAGSGMTTRTMMNNGTFQKGSKQNIDKQCGQTTRIEEETEYNMRSPSNDRHGVTHTTMESIQNNRL